MMEDLYAETEISHFTGWHSLSSWEPTDLCFRLWILACIFLLSSGSRFFGLLVVRSSVRRWPDTRVERRRQNKVKDSTMLIKADKLHWQDRSAEKISEGKEKGLVSRTCISYTSKNNFCNLPIPIPIPVVPLLGEEKWMPCLFTFW